MADENGIAASSHASSVPQSIHGSSESPSAISDPFGQPERSPSSQHNIKQDGGVAAGVEAPAGRRNNLPVSPPTRSHLPSSIVLQDGYDLDGGVNHLDAVEMEGPLELDKPDLGEVSEVAGKLATATNQTLETDDHPTFVLITDDAMKKMRVSDLKLELSKHGLCNKGLKQVLIDRLKQAMIVQVPVLSETQRAAEQVEERVSGFAPTARWK